MRTIPELQQIVEKGIQELDLKLEPKELYEPIVYFLGLGGKRLRPVLLMVANEMFAHHSDDSLKAALGIEVFHNFTLLHDDIMDKAPLRRNNPTVHKKWNESIGILAGDAMFVKSVELISCVPDNKLRAVLTVFSQTALEVCEGQQLDMNFESRENVSIEDYIHMITNKTAVLLGCSLKIGAIIGNAKDEDAIALYNFGKHIGIAFQLMDDILDVFGDPEKFGKQAGGDILSNKKTFLLLKAFENADTQELQILRTYIPGDPSIDPQQKIKIVTEVFERIGVKQLALNAVNEHAAIAYEWLEKVNVEQGKKQELFHFAEMLKTRNA